MTQLQKWSQAVGTQHLASMPQRLFGRTASEWVLIGMLIMSVGSAANGLQSWAEFTHIHFWVSTFSAFGTALVAYARGLADGSTQAKE